MPFTYYQLRRVFLAALRRPASERGAYLRKACGPDRVFRQRAMDLVGCREQGWGFMRIPSINGLVPSSRAKRVLSNLKTSAPQKKTPGILKQRVRKNRIKGIEAGE